MKRDNLLIVADSEQDANMLYAVRMFVPDPLIYLRMKGKCHLVMNDLEIDRGRLEIKVKVRPGPLFPQREFKTAEEVKKISAALMMAEVGLAEGILALKNSRIGKDRRLTYHNVPLTS